MRLLFLIALFSWGVAHACTSILINTADNSKVVGRSMEFGQFLNSSVLVNPRGQKVQSTAPNNGKGISWTTKYGYIALNGFGMDFAIDGMNEKGLSYGALWMPGSEYQKVGANEADKALSTTQFGPWILGNFATTAEVKQALNNVKVWGEPIATLNNSVPPAHMIISDTQGNSIVIEFYQGAPKVYDNPIGVLTNFPWFDWQLLNLQNFINLKALNANPTKMDSMVLGGTGQGSGLMGIPGDWTPPSRFVRAANFKEFAKQPKDAIGGVNLLAHLLNTVDIPIGDVVEREGRNPVVDYTQWIVIKDLSHLQFYYRTYEDLTLRKIDFSKVNVAAGASTLRLPLSIQTTFVDETNKLK